MSFGQFFHAIFVTFLKLLEINWSALGIGNIARGCRSNDAGGLGEGWKRDSDDRFRNNEPGGKGAEWVSVVVKRPGLVGTAWSLR